MSEDKKLEVISGDGSNLDISPVYDNINTAKPTTNKPKNVIIPQEKNNPNKNTRSKDNNDKEKENNTNKSDSNEQKEHD